jgi:peptidoglycan/LPS O-acetylase OafA/YrhL
MTCSPELPHHRIECRALSAGVSAHLDFIRSVAAWAVMWGHLRALFFIDFQGFTHPNGLLKILYALTGFGHEAVMVFFVLSGFLISSSILRSQASGTWSWAGYAISRATRLYVVLIPGLFLGTLWDALGKSLFASTTLYSQPLVSFGGLIVQDELTVRNFFCNLFFLQTIVCHAYGSNGPLWSIANEFWYYVLFPMGLFASYAWARKTVGPAILLTASALCVTLILGPEKLLGFLIWLAGFVVVLVWSRIKLPSAGSRAAYLFLSSALLVGCLVAARIGKLTPKISDLAVGLAFSAFLFAVLQLESQVLPAGPYLRSAHLFAGFSYTLYVLHFPFLLFLRAWILPDQRWQPDGTHLSYGAGIGVITLTFSWLVAVVTEHKTGQARRWVRKLLHVSVERNAVTGS